MRHFKDIKSIKFRAKIVDFGHFRGCFLNIGVLLRLKRGIMYLINFYKGLLWDI